MKGNKFQDPYEPTFYPNDPETFYVGTWFQGVYKIKNGELIAKYDWNNSPFTFALNWYCQILFTEFDKESYVSYNNNEELYICLEYKDRIVYGTKYNLKYSTKKYCEFDVTDVSKNLL